MRCKKKNMLDYMIKPVSAVVLLFLIFAIVWIRASVISLEYRISDLEEKKREIVREIKVASVERSSLLSVKKIETLASNEFVFPDRVKVVYVSRIKDGNTYMASLSSSQNPSGENN